MKGTRTEQVKRGLAVTKARPPWEEQREGRKGAPGSSVQAQESGEVWEPQFADRGSWSSRRDQWEM